MKKTQKLKEKGGIIKWIIIIIAIIALASFFFDFSVQEVVEDEQTQENFQYIWTNLSSLYQTYLSHIINTIWNFFLTYIRANLKESAISFFTQ
jgi:magnesium-transporting ATPase (P-type)